MLAAAEVRDRAGSSGAEATGGTGAEVVDVSVAVAGTEAGAPIAGVVERAPGVSSPFPGVSTLVPNSSRSFTGSDGYPRAWGAPGRDADVVWLIYR